MRDPIATEAAPGAVGPYSQAVSAGGFLWASGQVALDPATGRIVSDDVVEQARQVMANLRAVLEAGGSGFDRVALARSEPTDLGPYGWKLHLIADGEYCHLYVDADGGFLFYFVSW